MKARYINLVPLFGFVVVLGYGCYAATAVGHWPYYAAPDPSDLPAAAYLDTPTALLALLSLAAVLFIPFAYLVYRIVAWLKKWQLRDQKGAYVWYAVGATPWLVDLFVASGSRYSLISWILD